MTNELFLKIVSAIITIILALVSAYVIPWLKAKIGSDKLAKITEYTEMAVRCAEQIFSEDEFVAKKEYVVAYVTSICNKTFGLSLSAEDINILVESTVNSVKYGNAYTKNEGN